MRLPNNEVDPNMRRQFASPTDLGVRDGPAGKPYFSESRGQSKIHSSGMRNNSVANQDMSNVINDVAYQERPPRRTGVSPDLMHGNIGVQDNLSCPSQPDETSRSASRFAQSKRLTPKRQSMSLEEVTDNQHQFER